MQIDIPQTTVTVNGFELLINEISLTNGLYHLIGANGSGKTTFYRYLLGLIKVDSPLFLEQGELSVGYLPQNFRESLLPWLSVTGNLSINESSKANAIKLALEFGLRESDLSKRTRELSGGQSQRVALAREISFTSKVLLLDEPFSALDKNSCALVLRALRKLASDSNSIVIISTHISLESIVEGVEYGVIEVERETDTRSNLCAI